MPSRSQQTVALTGVSLSAEAVERVARGGADVTLAPEAWRRIETSRRVVEKAVESGMPLYGVTSGLGNRANEALPAGVLSEFSRMTIRGRAAAVGPALSADVVRALMVIRLNTLCLGRSGASREVAESLLRVLNAGLVAEMPETASIGSSDLCVMAHLGLALIGEGVFLDGDGTRPARDVLAEHGIPPLAPGPKDGLILCASNAFTAGCGTLALVDGLRALETAQTTAVMSMEGYRGNPSPLDPRASAARPQPGQERAAAGLRERLRGSRLYRKDGPRRLQDPLSLRCTAPVHGAAYAVFDFLWAALEPEVNGAGDNPVVVPEDAAALSTGNFQMPLLTVALDAAGQALAHVAAGAAGRCARLLDGAQAGLPENLSPYRPDGSGFAPLMKTVEALLAGIRHDAAGTPAELSAAGDGVEDTVVNAPLAAKKLRRLIADLEGILAIEALTAAQAIDLGPGRDILPPTVAAAYDAVRDIAPALDRDRPMSDEVRQVVERLVGAGILTGCGEQPL